MKQEDTASDGHEQSTDGPWRHAGTPGTDEMYGDRGSLGARMPRTGCPYYEDGRVPRPEGVGGMVLADSYGLDRRVELRLSVPFEVWNGFAKAAEDHGVTPTGLMDDLFDEARGGQR